MGSMWVPLTRGRLCSQCDLRRASGACVYLHEEATEGDNYDLKAPTLGLRFYRCSLCPGQLAFVDAQESTTCLQGLTSENSLALLTR